jgi:TatA/E family protein of Tat protein translocase
MISNPSIAAFMGLGGPEMAVIIVLLLLLFGAKKLPELARGIGRSLGEFRKAREDFEQEITKGSNGKA